MILATICIFFILISITQGFGIISSSQLSKNGFRKSSIKMEYIPDGLTKAQWEQLKKKEEDERKRLGNLGVMGVNRFKSRSFQAWQESGGKHLFPVNPNLVPYEERPYMQRKGGDWEGTDLSKKGLEGKDQGQSAKRSKTDDVYDNYAKQGLLNSFSIFGKTPLPWTTEATNKISQVNNLVSKQESRGVAGKKLSPEEAEKLKKSLFKPVNTKSSTSTPVTNEKTTDTKKKMFGLF